MKITIIAYIPVVHDGYYRLLHKFDHQKIILISNETSVGLVDYLRKDIRALPTPVVQSILQSMFPKSVVEIFNGQISDSIDTQIVMPDEDVSRIFASKYLGNNVVFESTFLRWDKRRVDAHLEPKSNYRITSDELAKRIMSLAVEEAKRSSDWWRQVGAVISKDGNIMICGFNRHVPSGRENDVIGDPRSLAHKGVAIELSTALHGEAGIIAEAARRGICLSGCDLFVTTFPCPPCAKLVAYSGIKRIFFKDGYAMLDGEDILKANGVEIIKVV